MGTDIICTLLHLLPYIILARVSFIRGGGVPRAEGPGLYLYNSIPTKFHTGTRMWETSSGEKTGGEEHIQSRLGRRTPTGRVYKKLSLVKSWAAAA